MILYAGFYLEELIRLPSPPKINCSDHLSVCPFVLLKHVDFSTWELKLGNPHGVTCSLSVPSKYLILCVRRKFGFNKKIRRKLLMFLCITNQICALHQQSMGWRNLSNTAKKSSFSPCTMHREYKNHREIRTTH
jgi:hypothetical protein